MSNKFLLWFDDLARREKIFLSIGVLVVLLTVFYLILIEPTQERLEKARNNLTSTQSLHAFMLETRGKVEKMKASSKQGQVEKIPTNRLLAYLDNSMKKSGIGDQVNTISPGKNDGVNLRFDTVNFDNLMQWLINLHFEKGINVISFTLNPTATDGFVKASLLLE